MVVIHFFDSYAKPAMTTTADSLEMARFVAVRTMRKAEDRRWWSAEIRGINDEPIEQILPGREDGPSMIYKVVKMEVSNG